MNVHGRNKLALSLLALIVVVLLAVVPAIAQDQSTVIVWMAGDSAQFMTGSDIPDLFTEAYPQYTVEIVPFPWDALHDKLLACFSGGECPSIAMAADHWVGEFAPFGGLMPLDDFVAERGINTEDFLPNSWEHFRYTDGVLYAAPYIWESRLLFYRTDILEEAGIDAPPTTLDELVEVGAQLTNGEDRFGLAHQESWLDFHFFSWILYAFDGDYFDPAVTTCTLTEPEGIAALEYYKQLYDMNIIPQDPAQRVETFQGFKEGYYAMAESGAWWFGLLATQAPELEGKWDIALLPSGDTTLTYGHPNPWVITQNAVNVEGALAWLDFMLQPEMGVAWAETYGQTPTQFAAFEDPAIAEDPGQQLMMETAARGTKSLHNIPAAETATELVWNTLAAVRDNVLAPADAAADLCGQLSDLVLTQ